MLTKHELKGVADEITKVLESDDKPFQKLSQQLNRLVSHLESDQRVYLVLEKELNDRTNKLQDQMDTHRKTIYGDEKNLDKQPGLVNEWMAIKKSIDMNHKIGWAIIFGIISLVMKGLYDILTTIPIKHP